MKKLINKDTLKYSKILLKLILRIILIGIAITFFIAMLWVTTTGEFNPPSIKKILFYSFLISAIANVASVFVKMHADKIEKVADDFIRYDEI